MELPKRKPTRLKGYDYSSSGAYFITICTKDRKEILSKILVGDGVLDVPQNELTTYGKIVEKYINQLSGFYSHITVDKSIIMPNHVHLLVSITDMDGTSETPSPTNTILAKFISTFKRFVNKECKENIWQRSFHDHIIRGEKDYRKIWEYIDQNVIQWEKDCFYQK